MCQAICTHCTYMMQCLWHNARFVTTIHHTCEYVTVWHNVCDVCDTIISYLEHWFHFSNFLYILLNLLNLEVLVHSLNSHSSFGDRIDVASQSGVSVLSINQAVCSLKAGRLDPASTKDILVVGSHADVLAYDVLNNKDIFHKEVSDQPHTSRWLRHPDVHCSNQPGKFVQPRVEAFPSTTIYTTNLSLCIFTTLSSPF